MTDEKKPNLTTTVNFNIALDPGKTAALIAWAWAAYEIAALVVEVV